MLRLAKKKYGPDGDRVPLCDDEHVVVLNDEGNRVFSVEITQGGGLLITSDSIRCRGLTVRPVASNKVIVDHVPD